MSDVKRYVAFVGADGNFAEHHDLEKRVYGGRHVVLASDHDDAIATLTERLAQESKAREGREALLQQNEALTAQVAEYRALLIRVQQVGLHTKDCGCSDCQHFNAPSYVLEKDVRACLAGADGVKHANR